MKEEEQCEIIYAYKLVTRKLAAITTWEPEA
jgi:hypothetical protein